MPRRRKRRNVWNPARYIPPEILAMVGKAIAGGLVVAAPAVAVRQEGQVRQQAANGNTNAALNSVALLIDEQDGLKSRILALELDAKMMRLRYARLLAKSPAAMVGPAVPADWLPQPPRKRSFWDRFKGG